MCNAPWTVMARPGAVSDPLATSLEVTTAPYLAWHKGVRSEAVLGMGVWKPALRGSLCLGAGRTPLWMGRHYAPALGATWGPAGAGQLALPQDRNGDSQRPCASLPTPHLPDPLCLEGLVWVLKALALVLTSLTPVCLLRPVRPHP